MNKKSAEQPERSGAKKPSRSDGGAGRAEGRGDHMDNKPCPTNVAQRPSPAGTADSDDVNSVSAGDEPKGGLPPSGAKQNCDLCEAARFTHWYHEDDTCWIADCEVCSVPMVVWKPHGTEPTDAEVEHMLEQLQAAGQTRFGHEPFTLDREMRTIPDHWHAHARDSDWFRLRMARPLSRYTNVGAERVER